MRLELTPLQGYSPIGFMAALGLLRVSPKGTRLNWSRDTQTAELHGPAVEAPQLSTGFSVERGGVVVRRRDVEHAVDHQRLVLESIRHRAVLFDRLFSVPPLPRDLQALHVPRGDVVERRVIAVGRITAVGGPLHLTGLGLRLRRVKSRATPRVHPRRRDRQRDT